MTTETKTPFQMNYLILGVRTDGTISELFRTGNKQEALYTLTIILKYSYKEIKLVQELEVK